MSQLPQSIKMCAKWANAQQRYGIIFVFAQPTNNGAGMPADVFSCSDTMSQTVAQGEQFFDQMLS